MTMRNAWLSSLIAIGLSAWPSPSPVRGQESADQWLRDGKAAVEAARKQAPITCRAKNIILFVGDGMGVTTVTAARILEGQHHGRPGEENLLSFEKLPSTAVIKTYNTDQQTPDSAGTMTAMVTGAKTRAGVLSVNQSVSRGDHSSVAANRLETILERAERAGLATGVVTTTRITHATPAACYAHSPEREWESDRKLSAAARSDGFPDIARQLVEFRFGDGIDVALGGGLAHFLPGEEGDSSRKRGDGRDLITEWTKRTGGAFLRSGDELEKLSAGDRRPVLGLFASDHLEYEHDRRNGESGQPSLTQMTVKAIELLSARDKGFFLMVEGGRIDHAHHAANPFRALTDTIEFSHAVAAAVNKTKREDTLIIVTADHSHVFTMAGYPKRGNPILGKVVGTSGEEGQPGLAKDATGRPYTTLGYTNGPGYAGASEDQPEGSKRYPHFGKGFKPAEEGRPDLTNVDTEAHDHLFECGMPLGSETHGGEDVIVYADGPMAYLFHGVREQNYIFHVMAEALGLNP